MYDYLIVGAGLFGAVFARQMKNAGKRCLVIEKRDHIAGNIYTEKQNEINVHKYGAHIFHTNDKEVWDYVNSYATFNRYTNSPVAYYQGELYNLPFNMNTFHQMWGVITPEEAQKKIDEQRKEALFSLAGITENDGENEVAEKLAAYEPKNLEEQAITLVGTDIYEKLIKGYTAKQWGRSCTELPSFIIKRLPVRFTYDNNYFNAKYQGIPEGGYTALAEKLLYDIDVKTGVDYFEELKALKETGRSEKLKVCVPCNKEAMDESFYNTLCLADKLVFTGQIDRYFGYSLGKLEYRSIFFENEVLETDNYQGNAVVNYTDGDIPFTRIIEHKWFEFGKNSNGEDIRGTIISKEFSKEWNENEEPYYPMNDEDNNRLYEEYKKISEKEKNVIFGGRLGEYKYYDMDQVIRAAIDRAETELQKTDNEDQ